MLNGTKRWITNGSIAQVALVWAKLDGKVRGFLVPTKTPGLHRARHPRQVVAARERDQRADPRGRARSARTRCCPASAACAARCRACRRRASASATAPSARRWPATTRRCRTRRIACSSRGPIAGYQLVQRKLVDMVSEITKAQLLCLAPRPAQGGGHAARRRRSRSRSATTSRWRATSRAMPATSSARTASPTSTSAAATC